MTLIYSPHESFDNGSLSPDAPKAQIRSCLEDFGPRGRHDILSILSLHMHINVCISIYICMYIYAYISMCVYLFISRYLGPNDKSLAGLREPLGAELLAQEHLLKKLDRV